MLMRFSLIDRYCSVAGPVFKSLIFDVIIKGNDYIKFVSFRISLVRNRVLRAWKPCLE